MTGEWEGCGWDWTGDGTCGGSPEGLVGRGVTVSVSLGGLGSSGTASDGSGPVFGVV